MVNKQLTISQLESEIAKERSKAEKIRKRLILQSTLKSLKRSGRTDFTGRIGRGLIILGKKTGGAVLKQGRLIRARQIEEAKSMKGKKKKGFTFDPMGSLNI